MVTVSHLCGGINNSQVADQIYLSVLFNPFCSLVYLTETLNHGQT